LRLKTSLAPRAALGLAIGASALLAAAPGASAQRRAQSDLRLSNISGVPATIQAGDAFRLRVTVANRGRRTARAARFYVALTRGNVAKSTGLRRLRTRNLGPFRPGRRSTYSTRIGIRPSSSGTYRLVICATQTGRRARCTLGRRITVTRRATTPPTTPPATPPALPLDQRLRAAITQTELLEHTNTFGDIAARNGNNRAAGTQGYDDSAAYVINRLTKAGWDARIDRFEYLQYTEDAPPTLTTSVSPTYPAADISTLEYSGDGDTGTVAIVDVDTRTTAPTDPPSSSTSGCEAADFAGFPAGAIALVQRGTCTFAVKAANAVAAGAVGVIVYNEGQPGRTAVLTGTLGGPVPGGADVPVIGTTSAIGEALRAGTPTGRITASTTIATSSSYNVLADSPAGDPAKTIVVGAHLDSVPEGPGVNDNGSGVAFQLELAEQMSRLGITPANKVRLAFWGAEESGLIGSTRYVEELSAAEFGQIGLNLNFDMLASPNHARFVYDGDFSDTPRPAGITTLARSSGEVEAAFNAYFASQGLATQPSAFDGRSDYKPFQDRGIPAGGLFSGAEGIKTPAQAALFGGVAGVAFDPNYHGPGDDKSNINAVGFEQMADAAAQITFQYATAATLPARYSAASGGAVAPRTTGAEAGTGGEWLGSHLQR
jgi:Zn-dependent M28 family amino/carboxypeptidase